MAKVLLDHLFEAAAAVRVGDKAGADAAINAAIAAVGAATVKEVPPGVDIELVVAKAAAHDVLQDKLAKAMARVRGAHLDRNANAKRARAMVLDIVRQRRDAATAANNTKQTAQGDGQVIALGKLHRELQGVQLPDSDELLPEDDDVLLGG